MIEFGVGFIVGLLGPKIVTHIIERVADRKIIPARVNYIQRRSKYVSNSLFNPDVNSAHPVPGQIWRLDSSFDDDSGFNVDVYVEKVKDGNVWYSFLNSEKERGLTLYRTRKSISEFMRIYKYMNCWKKLPE